MMVMMMAMTPSLNAARRSLPIVLNPGWRPLQFADCVSRHCRLRARYTDWLPRSVRNHQAGHPISKGLMPGVRAGLAQLILLPVFGVIFHDAAGQLVDDGLPRRGILATGQFRHGFCK